jgi:hypothetical protein
LKEVQIMRQLDHPNIVKLVDFSESKQYYYIILELAPGGELFHQIVRLTYFSEDLSRHVIKQVAEALAYLHEEKGVVHRCVFHMSPTFAFTDVIVEISSLRTYYSLQFRSCHQRIPSQGIQKMRTRLTKETLSQALELEGLGR